MSNYLIPPPSYGTTDGRKNGRDSQEPLVAQSSTGGSGSFYDQPAPGELPDDFKVRTPYIGTVRDLTIVKVWCQCLRKLTGDSKCLCS